MHHHRYSVLFVDSWLTKIRERINWMALEHLFEFLHEVRRVGSPAHPTSIPADRASQHNTASTASNLLGSHRFLGTGSGFLPQPTRDHDARKRRP